MSWLGLDIDVDVSEVNVSIGEPALIQTDWKALPFVQFEYFNDEADCFVQVDLIRKVPTWTPILFKDGVRLGDVPVEGVSERLAWFDITWAKGDQVPANQIGDTVALTSVRGDPWADLTVLGQPELVYETTARICLRVTSRAGKETSLARLGLELSTAPDTSGRIRHIWEESSVDDDGVALPDSFSDVTLARSEAYEAYAYFRGRDGEGGLPPDPFVTLWHLQSGFWVPIDVARREQPNFVT